MFFLLSISFASIEISPYEKEIYCSNNKAYDTTSNAHFFQKKNFTHVKKFLQKVEKKITTTSTTK